MPRSIVYDSGVVQAHYASMVGDTRPGPKAARQIRKGARAAAAAEGGAQPPASAVPTTPDDFTSKLIKYIPAETIALATLFFGAWTVAGDWVWFWVAVGALVNIGYLYGMTFASPQSTNPAWYFYLLSAAAFVAWAVATVDVVEAAASVDDSAKAGVILTFAALAIPTLDQILSAGTGGTPAGVPGSAGGAATDDPPNRPSGGGPAFATVPDPVVPAAGVKPAKKAPRAKKGTTKKVPVSPNGKS
jgi:hypothetical protein